MAGICLALRFGHTLCSGQLRMVSSCGRGSSLCVSGSAWQQQLFCTKPGELTGSRRSVALPELTLYTKTPCPLCDEALEALAPALHQVSLRKVDISLPENKRWYKLYRYDIPVFHFNNAFLMKHRGDLPVLLKALEAWKTSTKP